MHKVKNCTFQIGQPTAQFKARQHVQIQSPSYKLNGLNQVQVAKQSHNFKTKSKVNQSCQKISQDIKVPSMLSRSTKYGKEICKYAEKEQIASKFQFHHFPGQFAFSELVHVKQYNMLKVVLERERRKKRGTGLQALGRKNIENKTARKQ